MWNSARGVGLLSLLCFVGCSEATSVDLYDVEGTVSWDGGGPVEGATINFLPESGGVASAAVTDSEGKFRLRTATGAPGAIAGKHKVTITKAAANQGDLNDPTYREKLIQERSGGGGGNRNAANASMPAAMKKQTTETVVPQRYGSTTETPLTFEVQSGDNAGADFVVEKT